MDNNLGPINPNHTTIHRCEFFGLICLALVGVASIMGGVASNSFRLGREAKEREIAKEEKRKMKMLKKMNRGQ